jgi:hypothetical protein
MGIPEDPMAELHHLREVEQDNLNTIYHLKNALGFAKEELEDNEKAMKERDELLKRNCDLAFELGQMQGAISRVGMVISRVPQNATESLDMLHAIKNILKVVQEVKE